MKGLRQLVAVLGILVAVAAGSANVSAKPSEARRRPLAGLIVSIDRAARTMLVRETGTRQLYKVQVPDGRVVRTRLQTYPTANFEQLMPGMVVTELSVQ